LGFIFGEQWLRVVSHPFLRAVHFPPFGLLIRVEHDPAFESCAKPAPVDSLFFLETFKSLFGTSIPSTFFHAARTASF